MRIQRGWGGVGPGLFGAALVFAVGCGQADNKGSPVKGAVQVAEVKKTDAKEGSKHGGWWCDEHGIPEDECSMCSSKVAKAFKAKGDWCNKHDRALSQCFICNPKQREFYAAKYRAKYGKEPPPIEDDETGKDAKKDEKK